jgi:hypothetical protein
MHFKFSHHAVLAAVLSIPGIGWNYAHAYDWNSDYGIDLTIGFDDNYRLSVDDEVDTTSADLGMYASLNGATEISHVGFTMGANGRSYSESSIDDTNSYDLALDTERSSERLTTSLSLNLKRDLTVETELLDTGVTEDGTRDTVVVRPGLNYRIDERNSISSSLTARDVSYDTVSLIEYTDNALALGWEYELDEVSSVSANLRTSEYEPETGEGTDTDSVNIVYQLRTSELTTYRFSVGFTEVDRPEGNSDSSNTYSVNVKYKKDERNSFSFDYNNGYRASGSGDVREEDRLNMQWNRGLTDRTRFRLSTTGVNTDDRNFYSVQAGIDYQFARTFNTSASYRYRERDEDSGNADSSTIMLSLSYSPL